MLVVQYIVMIACAVACGCTGSVGSRLLTGRMAMTELTEFGLTDDTQLRFIFVNVLQHSLGQDITQTAMWGPLVAIISHGGSAHQTD